MSEGYDAIVVGARCGGSPTAMLLARSGHRVLLVDKATFPSDTMSTHLTAPARGGRAGPVGPPRAAGGHRLPADHELLVRLRARHDLGIPAPGRRDGDRVRPAADRARRAARRGRRRGGRRGARGLHGRGDPGRGRARDRHPRARQGRRDGHRARPGGGRRRRQALAGRQGRAAGAYNEVPPLAPSVLRLLERPSRRRLRDLRPRRGRPRLGGAAHQRRPHLRGAGLAAVGVRRQPQGRRGDVHADRSSSRPSSRSGSARPRGRRASRAPGDLPGYFRKPYGPGWALVGDAGYHKHPITAFGITDAFRDAEALAAPSTTRSPGVAPTTMRWPPASAPATRSRCRSTGSPATSRSSSRPPPEMQPLIGAMRGNQEAMDDFVSVMAGTLPAPEFFAPENVGRIMARGPGRLDGRGQLSGGTTRTGRWL